LPFLLVRWCLPPLTLADRALLEVPARLRLKPVVVLRRAREVSCSIRIVLMEFSVCSSIGRFLRISTILANSSASGKKKIASRVSGCTRGSRRTGRNLANPDAAYHGVGRPKAATTVLCVRTQRARAPCGWKQLLRHIRSGRGGSGH